MLDSFLKLKNLTRLQLSGNNLSLLNNVNVNATPQKFKLLGLASCNLSEFPNLLRSQDVLEFWSLLTTKFMAKFRNGFGEWENKLFRFEELLVLLLWTSLEVFKLQSNMFRGSLPHPPLSIISYLVSNNSLSGEIPPMLCNLSFLVALDLSNNNLTGMLWRCLASLNDSLKVVNLRYNHFTGAIPSTYTTSCGLKMMDLSPNQLQGRIPRSLAHCTKLEVLNLGNNLIMIPFPSWLGTLPKLKVLILKANGLHGVMGKPQAKSKFSKLQVIDLSNNRLKVLRNLKLIRMLNLSNNNLTGHIASSLGEILNLESLDLSQNKLSGKIPQQLANLNFLASFNISCNNLEGHISRGAQFNTFNNDSYAGNSRLCGYPLSKECENPEVLQPPPSLAPEKDDEGIESVFKFGWKIVLTGYGAGLVIGMSLGYNFTVRKHEWLMKVFKKWQ
ncbi:Leucine-rich repeat - like 10, partial [Theobroma cacao]